MPHLVPFCRSGAVSAEGHAGVVPAEAEGIRDAEGEFGLHRLAGRIVQVALGVGGCKVDRRRDNPLAKGHHRGYGLGGSGSSEHVSGHRLYRSDVGAVRSVAEGQLAGQGLRAVVEFRTGAVGVDVERVLSGVVARFAQGVGDAPRLGGAVGPPFRRRFPLRAQARAPVPREPAPRLRRPSRIPCGRR